MHDSQEAQHPAQPSLAFYAAMAKPEGDEETPGSCARAHQCAAEREGCEAGHRGTDARGSWLGELFPDGNCRSGVSQDGLLRAEASAPVAISTGRATGHEAPSFYRRSAIWDGTAQVDGHGEILHASHTPKIIVKPCAGKRHARFERGCNGNGSASLIPRHHLPMCGRYKLSRRKQIVEEYFDCGSDEPDWAPRYNIAPTSPSASSASIQRSGCQIAARFGRWTTL